MIFDRLHISYKTALTLFLASGFQAFGMYHIHATARITEGGIFGALLLLNHWFALSPALTSIVLNLSAPVAFTFLPMITVGTGIAFSNVATTCILDWTTLPILLG